MIEVEAHVPGDEQIEPAVAVEVAERATGRPAVHRDVRRGRDIRERPSMVVVVQAVLAEVGHVKILEAIVVDVSDADALAPALVRDAAFRGDVGEGAVPFVAKQGCGRSRIAASRRSNVEPLTR